MRRSDFNEGDLKTGGKVDNSGRSIGTPRVADVASIFERAYGRIDIATTDEIYGEAMERSWRG